MFREQMVTTDARQISITKVEKGSPADGILAVGDVILGVGGKPFSYDPRARLHDSPIDIKGAGKSVSVVVWAIRESGNHALARIWHEGTDLDHAGAARIVARGQRQYALFAGLNKECAACGHVSENGAKSFGHIYAMHKSNSGYVSPLVPADSPAGVLDASW